MAQRDNVKSSQEQQQQRDKRAEREISHFDALKQERSGFEAQWQDVEELVLPSRGSLHDNRGNQTPGAFNKRSRIFESTPPVAAREAAAMLSSQLINPSLEWLRLKVRNPELQDSRPIRVWLENTGRELLDHFNDPNSGFNDAANEMFLDLVGFGSGNMWTRETDREPFAIHETRPVQEAYFEENDKGFVDKVYLLRSFTLDQAAQFYGKENLPLDMQKRVDDAPTEPAEFLIVVSPREAFDPGKRDSANLPWQSLHIAREKQQIVRESGFNEWPLSTPRINKMAGEKYGNGLAMQVLGDIRMINRMQEVNIRGAQKVIDPPLQAPDDGVIGPLRTTPGGINIVRAGAGEIQPIQMGARPDLGEQIMDTVRQTILRAFFLNPADFRAPEPRVSATAIVDKRDERFRRMTPLINRLQREFLVPLVTRTMAILTRKGRLAEPPAELGENEIIDVAFSSPAAQAQLLTESDNLVRWLQKVSPALEADPEAALTVEWDEYVREQQRLMSVTPKVVRSREQVQAAIEQRRQDQQAQAAVSQLKEGSEAAKNISESIENANTAGEG